MTTSQALNIRPAAFSQRLHDRVGLTRLASAMGAVIFFHLGYLHPLLAPFVLCSAVQLLDVAKYSRPVPAFYFGLAIGFCIHAFQLSFFWNIFGVSATVLWLILAFYHALFCWAASQIFSRFKDWKPLLIIPLLWMGLEYFRSELYLLRFAWVTPGLAFSHSPGNDLAHLLGAYGIGFLTFFLATLSTFTAARKRLLIVLLGLALLSALQQIELPRKQLDPRPINVAGMQLEFPVDLEVPEYLDRIMTAHPETDLIVLSEYTFDGPIPKPVLKWCDKNNVHLIVGAKDELPENKFYNTAFVIDPRGEVIFKQVKSVPIQFFQDGLPAPERKLWDSPWGKFGICICYDLSYSKVVDDFIRQGAEGLIVPTMDVTDWGEGQHQLHARIAPIRSAEYSVPIFRISSSGISQAVAPDGKVTASGSFPGQEEIIATRLTLAGPGRLPLDRFLAPCAALFSAGFLAWLLFQNRIKTADHLSQT
jgi:apolipoprotein N-acyltransferase